MNDTLPPDLASLASLLRRAAQDEAPPAEVVARVIALDGMSARLKRNGSAALRRLIAMAVPDAAGTGFAPAWGVRGAAEDGHWLLQVEEFEVDLRAVARGERWAIVGQMFGMPQAQRVVLEGPATSMAVDLGPTFEFSFDGLPAGAYRLTVQGGDCEVVVPLIEIGSPDSR